MTRAADSIARWDGIAADLEAIADGLHPPRTRSLADEWDALPTGNPAVGLAQTVERALGLVVTSAPPIQVPQTISKWDLWLAHCPGLFPHWVRYAQGRLIGRLPPKRPRPITVKLHEHPSDVSLDVLVVGVGGDVHLVTANSTSLKAQ